MIFDTNILIYVDRGNRSAKTLIEESPHRAISAVTYMEYVPFCRDKNELLIFEKLLTSLQFKIYDIDVEISLQARIYVQQYALSHRVEMGDALIAATALKHGEVVCTSNIKHFKPINGLKIKNFNPDMAFTI